MNSTGTPGSVDEGALQYIREQLSKATKPVFLVVSIVNPHDVLFYPKQVPAGRLLEGCTRTAPAECMPAAPAHLHLLSAC